VQARSTLTSTAQCSPETVGKKKQETLGTEKTEDKNK